MITQVANNINSISTHLNEMLENRFVSVSSNNPILGQCESLKPEEIEWVIRQYCFFPKSIISMLVAACYSLSNSGWDAVTSELLQNIKEEMGEGDGKISNFSLPHYTILRKMVKNDFGMDLNESIASSATLDFVKNVKLLMDDNEPAFVAGSCYALESSAVPELQMLKNLVVTSLGKRNQTISVGFDDFFEWHINDIEVEHRDRLLEVSGKYLETSEDWLRFERGFVKAMLVMDSWWITLNDELTRDK